MREGIVFSLILFVTTADTDLLAADRALEAMPADFPEAKAFNPVNMSSSSIRNASEDGNSGDPPEVNEQQAILTAADAVFSSS
tara:strand:- start:50 stop:298 length:249 start_codon:yes stop_codon:yes gene_type:complete